MNKSETITSIHFWKRQISRFRHPDFHGVSTSYISQYCKLLNSLSELQNTAFYIDKHQLQQGFRVSNKIMRKSENTPFPDIWNVEVKLASYLYAYVLAKRPKVVVETGIANGFSTRILMKALEQTGGTLHSFDTKSECKKVYQGKGNWKFHLVPSKNQVQYFKSTTHDWEVDLWFHDGNHSYMWQRFEYELAFSRLAIDGTIISDDVDASEAWVEFCERNRLDSLCVFDSRKIFGIAKLLN